MSKEQEIMEYLDEQVFQPALRHPLAPDDVKTGIRVTRLRLAGLDAAEMIDFFWHAACGMEPSLGFTRQMERLRMKRFEELKDSFRARFDDAWLRAQDPPRT